MWNFLHGQFFRMSIYNGATWNTELDVSRITRPDSLLAFHVEPMLIGLIPIYAAGGIVALLALQAGGVAAGALPAFRLGRQFSGTPWGGLAISVAYLLSPFGQWVVLADFHTTALAAPLLLLSLERWVVARAPIQALVAAALAATAREDVGPVVAALGLVLLVWERRKSSPGLGLIALGLGWTILSLLVIRKYSGGVTPFEVRYGPTLGAGLVSSLAALGRRTVLGYLQALVLDGGWLGLLAPLALLPALPTLALNALSSSDWMAAGKAHYSALALPCVTLAAAAGLRRAFTLRASLGGAAAALLVLGSLLGYVQAGAGPFGANYAPAALSDHASRAAAVARTLPADAAVSASTSLVPRVSQRSHVYVFPSVLDADYVFLDLQATPAPTSAGDVFLRVHALLASGEWQIQTNADGLLLLQRVADADADATTTTTNTNANANANATDESLPPAVSSAARSAKLLSAALVPSPDGALGVDGPHWILRTVWQIDEPLPPGSRLDFWVQLSTGERMHLWDIASLWWNPPERWPVGQPVTVDVPDIPVRTFSSWSASWSMQ
jgi:uncharacterized membrane protein